jgi:SAM-dependent methyltransferase
VTDSRKRQAQRALQRQLDYQREKSLAARGHEQEYIEAMCEHVAEVRAKIERIRPIAADARIVEVGCGAHGLAFCFGEEFVVGVDPLAHEYAALFPAWQSRVPTVAAAGEALPFADASFDIVLCDNVVDHAEDPARIVHELARVLAPGGLLYFTVNVHHAVYGAAARLHSAWNALGLHYEIGPFADHTVHLTPAGVRRMFADLPLRVIAETLDIADTLRSARQFAPRHAGDVLKRFFYKNAVHEIIAVRAGDEAR